MKYFAQRPIHWKFYGVENLDSSVEIAVNGSKHAFIYIFLGALFEPEKKYPIVLENVPDITDVYYVCEYARGAEAELKVDSKKNTITIMQGVKKNIILTEYVLNCRSALLAFTLHAIKYGYAKMYNGIGGCRIGERNIDQHIRLWNSIGFDFEENENYMQLQLNSPTTKKADIFSLNLDTTMGSVAAIYCLRHGWIKRLENTSTRVEIDALIEFYARCGCRMLRNTRMLTRIRDYKKATNIYYRIPDDIDEAIGWACLCHCIGREAIIYAKLPPLQVLRWLEKLSDGEIIYRGNYIKIMCRSKKILYKKLIVEASYYPNIGSDQQPILTVWSSLFSKRVITYDHKFTKRYGYLKELEKVGWNVQIEEGKAILSYLPRYDMLKKMIPVLEAKDLRGGFAEIMGILASRKQAVLIGAEQLLRGYSAMAEKLKKIGINYTECPDYVSDSVAVVLQNRNGKFYFQKRDSDAEKNPGILTFFGGRREKDESPIEAAKRELREELELDVGMELVDEIQINEKFFSSSGKVYLFRASVPVELSICHEGQICLLDKTDLFDQKMSTFVRCAIENYLSE